jgi:hypothetical protein
MPARKQNPATRGSETVDMTYRGCPQGVLAGPNFIHCLLFLFSNQGGVLSEPGNPIHGLGVRFPG